MPTLSVTVAGLIAVIIQDPGDEAAVVLVDHEHHKHHPVLLIPANCISNDAELAALRIKDASPWLSGAILPGDVADYAAYDVTGYNLDVTNKPVAAGFTLITEPAPPSSGCPNGNWDSIDWLLNLNVAANRTTILMKEGALRRSAPMVAALLGMGHGRLGGHEPVERSSKIHKLSYNDMAPRAYTDAARWSTTVAGDIEISFTNRSNSKRLGTLKLKTDTCDALLVNLPDPKLPGTIGGHIDAFRRLPFADGTPVGTVVVNGACGTGSDTLQADMSGAPSLTVTVTTSGPAPLELSVSATARYAGSQVVEGHLHRGTNDLEPRGDSLCMGLVIHVASL